MKVLFKRVVIAIGVIAVLVGAAWIIFWSSFTLLDVQEEKLLEITTKEKGYRLGVFFLPSNATAPGCIQVRKIGKGRQEVIASYERYNFVADYWVVQGDAFALVLQDTMGSVLGAPDTVCVAFN